MDYGLHMVTCVLLLACGTSRVEAGPANRIVAVVNDEVITETDVKSHMNALLQQNDIPMTDAAQAESVRRVVLQRLIEERLIIQEAKRLNLTVEPEEVAQRLKGIKEQVGTKDAYEHMLQETGLNEEELKVKIREQVLAQKAINQEVRSRLTVSPSELTQTPDPPAPSAAIEEVRALHLLIRVTPERSAEQAQALVTQLHDQIAKGAPFEELARKYSEEPHAQEGGLMGWVRPGELLPELDAALFKLQPGGLSDPLRSKLGFHLLKVVERRQLSQQELSEARQRLEHQVYQQKFAQALEQWLAGLKKHAYISVADE